MAEANGRVGRHIGVALILACLLAGCNQSGRPPGVAPPPEPTAVAPAPVSAADFGKMIGGDYVVAPGDTLAVVADRTNTPLRSLIDMNNLQPPYALAPGMRLALKQRSQYVVQPDDTLAGLAQRYGVAQSALVSINNLRPPYVVKPGQRISIPSATEAANPPAMSATAVPPVTSAPLAAPGMESGSLSSAPIASASALPVTTPPTAAPAPAVSGSVSAAPLPAPSTVAPAAGTTGSAAAKPLAPPPQPGVTQTTALPAPAAIPAKSVPAGAPTQVPASPAGAASAPAPSMPALPAAPVSSQPVIGNAAKPAGAQDTATETAMTAPDAAMEAAPAAGSGKGPFVWPVQGKVIGAFGSSKDGLKNDGINIAAPAGAPVVAAADGVVAYAGNELRGFGNMILLRHNGGYVTAYAHNASLLVKKGDTVKRGQTIARVGATGAVFGPQLHFEIRKGTEPVDPMTLLGG